MKKPIKTYDTFDVVVVPFPFVDTHEVKKRPALVLSSSRNFNNHTHASVMAMITSQVHTPWPCDVIITDLEASGLPVQSIIRMKLFTLDHRLIIKCIGKLGKNDQKTLTNALHMLLPV